MQDKVVIDEFIKTWKYTRTMTTEFIEGVPDSKWGYSHHPKFAPLCKQFKHMTKIYGLYVDAIENQKMDFSKKNSYFSGEETKENILKLLSFLDEKTYGLLNRLKANGLEGFSIKGFGMTMGFTEFTHIMIQHEVSHFGIWANYAAFGEFETPKRWQEEWKL